MSLAGNELAYFVSAELVAKYYSLERPAPTDVTGQVADASSTSKAFTNMLASAERTARASARAARIATGAIPVQAKLAYQHGDACSARATSTTRSTRSTQYWMSSAYSQTAVMLARN